MREFDGGNVLEHMLAEAPVLSNRRKTIRVKGERRTIYAFYFNQGVQDPELQYNRVSAPLPSSADSSLCEVYSFWEEDPNVKALLRRLRREGHLKEGEVMNQGPWIKYSRIMSHNDFCHNVIEATRNGSPYSFFHSGFAFLRHFNKVCGRLRYDARLIDLGEDHYRVFSTGAVALEANVPRSSEVEALRGHLRVRSFLDIDLDKEDPSLKQVFREISRAYRRVSDPSVCEIYVASVGKK